MFTGIIENLGTVAKVEKHQTNLELYVESSLASELKIDQSVAHNGICLTVVEILAIVPTESLRLTRPSLKPILAI